MIKHAKVMDVFNQEWIDADVAVENGQIVGIGEYEGEQELDAAGQMLVPGFIDTTFISSPLWLPLLNSPKLSSRTV